MKVIPEMLSVFGVIFTFYPIVKLTGRRRHTLSSDAFFCSARSRSSKWVQIPSRGFGPQRDVHRAIRVRVPSGSLNLASVGSSQRGDARDRAVTGSGIVGKSDGRE